MAGGFILITMHLTMVWYLAMGAGISALSNAIDVCFSIHQSALISRDGDSRSTEGPKARSPKAAEQMSESRRFLRKQEKRRALSDKRSDLLTVGGVRFWSKERSDVARNQAMGGQRGP